MSRLTGWWAGHSEPYKIELYTRWSFHAFAVAEIGLIGLPAASSVAAPLRGWLLLLVTAHAILCGVFISRGLDWALGRSARPVRLMAAVVVLSVIGCVAAVALIGTRAGVESQAPSYLLVAFGGFGIGSVVVGVRRAKNMLLVVLAGAAIGGLAGPSLGLSIQATVVGLFGVLLSGLGLAFTSGFSVWLVRTVWELDSARELQTRLAVAEERLRFGRDLHDVMGRDLAVIALKSELAVQLAQRGRPEAAEQMVEVQRIARASQRDVRAVVRGYREADLHIELEGARGVLGAAGIDCRIDGVTGGAATGLTTEVQSALGWVVREAATNVLRHGDARHCAVRLTVHEREDAVLTVENDGAPVPGTTGSPGAGLAGLRERLSALNGTLEAGPTPGARFRLIARIPLPHGGDGEGPAGPSPAAHRAGPGGRARDERAADGAVVDEAVHAVHAVHEEPARDEAVRQEAASQGAGPGGRARREPVADGAVTDELTPEPATPETATPGRGASQPTGGEVAA